MLSFLVLAGAYFRYVQSGAIASMMSAIACMNAAVSIWLPEVIRRFYSRTKNFLRALIYVMIFGLISGFGLTQGTTDIGILVAPVMLNMVLYYFVLKDSRRNGGEK